MARIICLACSVRPGGYCVAGVDPESGRWVRPVSGGRERAITFKMMAIDGKMPELLDVLEVPLADTGPDEGCQPENRLVLPGPWRRVDRVAPKDILRYCEDEGLILHNDEDSVQPEYFQTIPRERWKSLQLVHAKGITFQRDSWNRQRWRALLRDKRKHLLYLKVTDPAIEGKLAKEKPVSGDCIVTVSLTSAWKPPDKAKPPMCYKLVAGVVEL